MTYQWRECIPRPKGNEESEPGEEEYTPVHVDWVQERNGSRFVCDRIDLRGLERKTEIHHLEKT